MPTPNILFLEPGTVSTRDLSLYSGLQAGNPSTGSSVTSPAFFNSRSLKLNGTTGDVAFTPPIGVNAGQRAVMWFEFDALPSATFSTNMFGPGPSGGGSSVYRVVIDSNGKIGLNSGASSTKFGSTVFSINTKYRICISHVITSTTNFTISVFITSAQNTVQSVAEVTATGADFTLATTSGDLWQVASRPTGGAAVPNTYIHSLYMDDASTLDDAGDKRAGERQYNATNTNNWDTVGGSGTNRWDYVNDHPLSDTNFLEQAAAAQQTEVFGIQNATQNDVDISTKTLMGFMAWYRAAYTAYTRGDRDLVTSKGTTSTTTTFPGVSTANTGDYVVVWFADQVGGSAPTVAQLSGTATIGAFTALTTATSTVRLQAWRAKITAGGTYTLQFTHASSNAARVGICGAWPSWVSSSELDANPACTSDGTSAYDGPNSGALGQADEVAFGAFAFAGPSTDTIATGTQTPSTLPIVQLHSGGTTGGAAASNVTLYVYWAPVQATTAVAMQLTNSTANRAGVQSLATFKASGNLFAGSAKFVSNGSDNAAALTSATAMYQVITMTSTYPTGAFGMKSTGLNPTFFYEGGVVVGYDNATAFQDAFMSLPQEKSRQVVNLGF